MQIGFDDNGNIIFMYYDFNGQFKVGGSVPLNVLEPQYELWMGAHALLSHGNTKT